MDTPPLILSQRRIYVLPTRAGLAYASTLVLMLVASINYNLSLGYGLTFLLGGLGVVTIIHTFRNLAGLRINTGRSHYGFAGERIHFTAHLENQRTQPRYGLRLELQGGDQQSVALPAGKSIEIALPWVAPRRGWHAMPRLSITTTWPLGLVRAWSYAYLPERSLAYAKPASHVPPLPYALSEGQAQIAPDADDFAGLRAHQITDPMQHVAWKASARLADDALLSKQFASSEGLTLWLDWQHTPGADIESRIATLTRWVLDADRENASYGLRLPGVTRAPAKGAEHLQACLTALAIHE